MILAWLQSWNKFDKLTNLWCLLDLLHKNMSHERLSPFHNAEKYHVKRDHPRILVKKAQQNQPEQIQKGVVANQNPLLSQLTLKTTSLKRQPSYKTSEIT